MDRLTRMAFAVLLIYCAAYDADWPNWAQSVMAYALTGFGFLIVTREVFWIRRGE